MSEQILRLGIPAGSLKNATVDIFAKAGFHILDSSRSYLPRIDDEQIQLTMLRAQEMSKYVEDGVIDAGITGYDWILENGSDVVEICELAYSKATSKLLVIEEPATMRRIEEYLKLAHIVAK